MLSRFLKDYGYIAVWITQVAWFAVTWWYRKSVVTREEFDGLSDRMQNLETLIREHPTAKDIRKVSIDMERMRGDMRAFSATIDGARQTFEAKLDGAAALLKRTETQLGIITQHLLEESRS